MRTVPAGRAYVASRGADEANLDRCLLDRCIDLGKLRSEAGNITARQGAIMRAIRIAREAQARRNLRSQTTPTRSMRASAPSQARSQDDPDDKAGELETCHDLDCTEG